MDAAHSHGDPLRPFPTIGDVEFFARGLETQPAKAYHEVQAGDVEVGEVGAVGFVHVEVDFEGCGTGGKDHWLEEGGAGKGLGGEKATGGEGKVREEATEGANLWWWCKSVTRKQGEGAAKGRLVNAHAMQTECV